MSNISNNSLTIFMTVQFINIGALIADYLAKMAGLPEITTISVNYPILGVSLVLIEFASPITLGLHFWYTKYPETEMITNSTGE
jgi:hypothetical protein